jgi:flagellar biogenesis protein FliO
MYLVNQPSTPGDAATRERSATVEHAVAGGTTATVTPAVANETDGPHTVRTADFSEQTGGSADARRLAPPSDTANRSAAKAAGESGSARGAVRQTSRVGAPWDSIHTVVTALAIVVGAFLLFAWLLRRGTRGTAAALLPAEVISVLGRVPLTARHVAQLLRVGNKLVLISVSPSGTQTLTEVTDAAEVDRLAGLCQQADPHSTTKAFEQVFRQLAREPAPNGFLGGEATRPTFSPPDLKSFRIQRDEAPRAEQVA